MSYEVVKQVLNIDPAKLSGVSERFMLTVLAEHANRDGTNAFPSLPRLARLLGVTEDRAYRLRRNLRRDGWIIPTERTRYKAIFKINMGKVRLCAYTESDGDLDSVPTPGLDKSRLGARTVPDSVSTPSRLGARTVPDSVPTQSYSSGPALDSSEDSPTPPGVRVCVSSKRDEFYDECAFHAWCLYAPNPPGKKTKIKMARLIQEYFAFDDPDQWEDGAPTEADVRLSVERIMRVMMFARHALESQPGRYLMKNPLKFLTAEHLDGLVAEAEQTTLDKDGQWAVDTVCETWTEYLKEGDAA